MNARRRKSKKQSVANSKSQLKHFTFFIERNLGKYDVAQCLRDAGANVEIHDDHLAQDSPDEKWISLVGRKNWIAITEDRHIRYRTAEKLTIIDFKARVVVVRAKNMTGKQKGEFLAGALNKIQKYANENSPPFIVGIDRSKKIRSYDLED